MQKITTYLTFKDRAEEAVKFYVTLFKNSKIHRITRSNGTEVPIPEGGLLNASFSLDGQEYMAMDGGEHFDFGLGASQMVICENQDEVDHFWDSLIEGGEALNCGWLRDRYGLVWQITPRALMEYLEDPDKEKSGRVMAAMMKMIKIEIEPLKRAYEAV